MMEPSFLRLILHGEINCKQVSNNNGLIEMQGEISFDHIKIPLLHFQLLSPLLVWVPCPCGMEKPPLSMVVVTSSTPLTAACLGGAGQRIM